MPDEILGLPVHALIVHATVVIVPLAALGTLAIAAVPRWRQTYGWLVVLASAVSVVLVPLTTSSGNRLLENLRLGGPTLEKVTDHQELGERVIYAVVPLFVLNLLLVLAVRYQRPRRELVPLAGVAALAALVAGTLVVLTGHLGAQAVWDPAG